MLRAALSPKRTDRSTGVPPGGCAVRITAAGGAARDAIGPAATNPGRGTGVGSRP